MYCQMILMTMGWVLLYMEFGQPEGMIYLWIPIVICWLLDWVSIWGKAYK